MEQSHSNPLYICQFSDFLAPLSNCPAEMSVYCMWKICICMSIRQSHIIHTIYCSRLCLMESIQWVSKVFKLQTIFKEDFYLNQTLCFGHVTHPGYFYIHIIWDRSPITEICLEEEWHVLKVKLIILFSFFFTYWLVTSLELCPTKLENTVKCHERNMLKKHGLFWEWAAYTY